MINAMLLSIGLGMVAMCVILAAEIAAHLALGKTVVPLAADFEDGLRVQEVLDALRLSSTEERWVPCGPDQSSG